MVREYLSGISTDVFRSGLFTCYQHASGAELLLRYTLTSDVSHDQAQFDTRELDVAIRPGLYIEVTQGNSDWVVTPGFFG